MDLVLNLYSIAETCRIPVVFQPCACICSPCRLRSGDCINRALLRRLLVYMNHLLMDAALSTSQRLLPWRFMLFSLIVAATFGCGNQPTRQTQVPCMVYGASCSFIQHAVVQSSSCMG
jgi:hypothetical protein